MKTKFYRLLTLAAFLTVALFSAQDAKGPTFIGTADKMFVAPAISTLKNPEVFVSVEKEMKDRRFYKHEIVPGKDPQKTDDHFVLNRHELEGKIPGKTPSLVFDAAASTSQPTDPALAVGPDHVFVVFNTGFIIYDKNGTALTGQLTPSNIFGTNGCCDLTASYDHVAQRWVVSLLGNGAYVAVSKTSNPVTTQWNVYQYSAVNDYQKLSVWSDGYYMTDNTSSTNKIYAFEREKMLAGDPAAKILAFPLPGIVTSGFFSPQFLTLSDTNAPSPGNVPVVYMQDDAWSGVSQDHIKLWNLNVNWATPASSTISQPVQINIQPFIGVFDGGSFYNLVQPNGGATIDALQATIMNQAQFRKFATHNSAVFNFVVDTDASAAKRAGIRWIELRQSGDGQPWSLYQEGTYTAAAGKHAWNASLIMDMQGNIGMGYTAMGGTANKFVGSYYTGRKANDPLGTMTIAETIIKEGNANIPGGRYGDYSKIDIDPSDNKTMWYDTEYMNNGRKNVIGVFKIAPNYLKDVGVVSIDTPVTGALTNAETVKVKIYNFGENPQSNIPVSFKVNGATIATETYTGTIAPAATVDYTFTAKANLSTEGQTYAIAAETSLAGDEDLTNNGITKNVTHVFQWDASMDEITAPVSGGFLNSQPIKVKVSNKGTQTITSLPVAYNVDGGSWVNETITTPIPAGGTFDYTFTAPFNFSQIKSYNVTAKTMLPNDSVPTNDEISKTVVNSACYTSTNNTQYPIGPGSGVVTNSVISQTGIGNITKVKVKVNLTHTWVGDVEMKLIGPDNTEVMLANRRGSSGDNYTNTIFDDDATTAISSGTPPFTGTFKPESPLSAFNGKPITGNWTLRITDKANGDGGQLLNWSLEPCSDAVLAVSQTDVDSNKVQVVNVGNNKFKVILKDKAITGNVNMNLYNGAGQQVLVKRLNKTTGEYSTEFDMSYAPKGLYIVKLSDGTNNFSKKILVK
ncbi:proprotein convertase P-domain-containing protein [Chryseobacterium suipulveris]|uniref:Proprotein convertase P-domain-containing protein n=1 Tax=Chryseobacterium suipulveris TaxID=2929800 RepID=A0ABY4BRA4_9FLAO|nr:proprotein convertase P-domain-containing protein [Chryseobacterium suipulveris]UOE40351.1 proprotein convertase P-domain-containing protein [Chryseobacterium suipulveris]